MSAIEKALLEATGEKPQKKSEDRQKYLLRLALAANDEGKLSEDEWEALEAQDGVTEWVKAAVEADNAEKEIEDFPDLAGEEPDEEEAEDGDAEEDGEDADDEPEEGEEEEVETKAKVSGAGGAKKAAAKEKKSGTAKKKAAASKPAAKAKPEKAPAKKPGGAKAPSMRRVLKMILVKKPKTSLDDLIAALEKKGHKAPSKLTVSSIRADTRDTMKVLVEAGMLEAEV